MSEVRYWRGAILLGAALLGAGALGSCGMKEEGASTEADGESFFGTAPRARYAGVGITNPGEGWAKIKGEAPKAPEQAKLADDDHVIVVVDNRTGEIRLCGDLSGFCISQNPWAGKPGGSAPVTLARPTSKQAEGAASQVE